ncbi:ABC transporter ATP-binding protein [Clostridium butyricum]|uniref:ABC transporter, ATP-binding/permease protein n=2 Tax=Clostridia TaxID=186801 RepID=C4IIW4_CLOBU|nr:ABC transporter ATP-binding protein [Clostridium butyricum]EDT76808.1 ABC transporter, ATP-binding/permease protein [Clostridium butyricum 5521]EEP52956.1 ABC transporter, ATP-binding/permease protein [Clostridium butyricum E4 str. BoNT E BL5262]MDU5103946.1 ABC transporter ATP-binding protein [Clostridium butyricum]NFL31440.1 ABC transporter ATP-binding protein [Clostridium butyricum]NFS17183.1 ABC transporter ATP-binding protein [Clostridium butyricum]
MSNEDRKMRPTMGGMGQMRGMGGGKVKAKNFKGSMKKLFNYLFKYKFSVILVIFFAIGSTAFSIIGPKILGNATTEIFNGIMSKLSGGSGIDFTKISRILITLLVIYLISAVFSFIQGFIMTGVSQKLTYRLRKEMIEKIDRMPMNYFDRRTHGEVLSRITNDIDTLNQSLNQSMTQIITSITTIIGIVFMMCTINVIMTCTIVLIVPISLIFITFIAKKSQKYFKEQQDYLGHVNGQVEEVYGGHNIVKVFNGEEDAINRFNTDNETLYKSAWKSQFLSGLMQPIMMFISNIGYVAVAILGGFFAIQNKISVGDIQSFIQYTRSFTQPLAQIAQISNMLQSIAASSERVFEFLEEEEEVQFADNPESIENIEGNVEFRNVKFGYYPDKTIINNFSLKVNEGKKVAIVGPTGAGKSTIIKILMRFYDINNGDILIDGKSIYNFNRRDLRKLFGMVLQETWLFNGSIKENIRYGNLDASDEEVHNAAESAEADEFISTFHEGYDMILNEEVSNVSQGQKQLLTIARAILKDPKILILDEATSSVDTRTELKIQKAMDTLMEGRTSFIIAHRLSTIKNADIILVLKDGDIIEQGNHEELMAMNGFYTNLYNSQFEKTAAN